MVGETIMSYTLSESFKALVDGIFGQDKAKSERLLKAFEEVVNDRATNERVSFELLKRELLDEAKKELVKKPEMEAEVEKLRNQLATKADIRELKSEIKDIRSEIKDIRSEIKDIRSEMKDIQSEIKDVGYGLKNMRYAIYGILVLIIIFDTPVSKIIEKAISILQ